MAKRGVGGGAGGGPRTSTQPLVSWATAVPTKEAARRRERMLTPQNDEVLARGHKRNSAPSPKSLPSIPGLRIPGLTDQSLDVDHPSAWHHVHLS